MFGHFTTLSMKGLKQLRISYIIRALLLFCLLLIYVCLHLPTLLKNEFFVFLSSSYFDCSVLNSMSPLDFIIFL